MKHQQTYVGRRFGGTLAVLTAAALLIQSGAALSLEPTPTHGEVQVAELKEIKQSITVKPPLSKNGYRLFACLELDGEDCGKEDHREIANQYCAKEGYSEATYKVESRKVKAETLEGGEYCSTKKCKVFQSITCNVPIKKEES
ncbi:MAG: hypothetical protein K1X51_17530 [Rhodospirillaceae bacterium]|nr:hypothetical protein [Rhodospirillaceae bacterium]